MVFSNLWISDFHTLPIHFLSKGAQILRHNTPCQKNHSNQWFDLVLPYFAPWCFGNFFRKFLFLKKEVIKIHPLISWSSHDHFVILKITLPVSSTSIVAPNYDVTNLQFERNPNWNSNPHPGAILPNLVTKTVSGFMNFVTTVGNTVMVFTPQLGQASRPPTGRLKTMMTTYQLSNLFRAWILV